MTKTKVEAPQTPGSFRTSQQAVVDAAISCFSRFGPSRTSMNDIADEAKISRKTLYRMFEDRPALIKRVLTQIYINMGDKIEVHLSKKKDVREAFIEGSIAMLNIVLKDKLLNEIVQAETQFRIEKFLLLDASEIAEVMHRVWSPVIRRGRQEGAIRPALSDDRILEMLQGVQSLIYLRQDEGTESQRAFLGDLLWPALTNKVR